MDLQEGNIGLMKAVDKFSMKRLQIFNLRNLVDKTGNYSIDFRPGETIRVPVHMMETVNKINRLSRQLLQELGRPATIEELSEKMELPQDKVIRRWMPLNSQFRWKRQLEMMTIQRSGTW